MFRSGASRKFGSSGFTLIEMAIVILIIAVLVATLTPIAANYVEQARVSRAQADVAVIGDAISRYEKDTGRYPMFPASASPLFQDSNATVVRLEGPGTAPTESAPTMWTKTTGLSNADCVSSCTYSLLSSYLLLNTANVGISSNQGKPFTWRGPYLDVQADPWGRKYLVNIIHTKSSSSYACFVLSAGPNGQVDTSFDITEGTSVTPLVDDIIFRVR